MNKKRIQDLKFTAGHVTALGLMISLIETKLFLFSSWLSIESDFIFWAGIVLSIISFFLGMLVWGD